jgi:IS30 family transposase
MPHAASSRRLAARTAQAAAFVWRDDLRVVRGSSGPRGVETAEEGNRATLQLLRRHPGRCQTITSDNGTEFHRYAEMEAASGVKFYFATPHHSWERGTNENTNGLIRQYLPKGESMTGLTQKQCDAIAQHLNNRPRKRHGHKTPNQCFHNN